MSQTVNLEHLQPTLFIDDARGYHYGGELLKGECKLPRDPANEASAPRQILGVSAQVISRLVDFGKVRLIFQSELYFTNFSH